MIHELTTIDIQSKTLDRESVDEIGSNRRLQLRTEMEQEIEAQKRLKQEEKYYQNVVKAKLAEYKA